MTPIIVDFRQKMGGLFWGDRRKTPVLKRIAGGDFGPGDDELAQTWFRTLVDGVKTRNFLLRACEIYSSSDGPLDLSRLETWTLKKGQTNYSNWCRDEGVSDREYALAIAALLGVGNPKDSPTRNKEDRLKDAEDWFASGIGHSWIHDDCEPFMEKYIQAYRSGELRFPQQIISHIQKPARTEAPDQFDVDDELQNQPKTSVLGPRWSVLAGVTSTLAVTIGLAIAYSTSATLPEMLKGARAYAECVPGGGQVTVNWTEPTRAQAAFDCPANGWLALPSPDAIDEPVSNVVQSDPALTLFRTVLTYGSKTRSIYRPAQSVTELAFARREPKLHFKCKGTASSVLINQEGRTIRLDCSDIAYRFVITRPAEARVNMSFRDADNGELSQCKTVIGHVGSIDLTDPTICVQHLPEAPDAPPLRAYLPELDTFVDPETGLVWMRDLFRYGSGARIEPENEENSFAVLIEAVSRDTGQKGWRLATEVEAKSVNRKAFLSQGTNGTNRLRGIIAGTPCATGGFGKLDISADPKTSALGSDYRLARPCNLNAPNFGLWLVRNSGAQP